MLKLWYHWLLPKRNNITGGQPVMYFQNVKTTFYFVGENVRKSRKQILVDLILKKNREPPQIFIFFVIYVQLLIIIV